MINNQIHSVVAKLGNDKDIFKGAEKKITFFFRETSLPIHEIYF